MSDRRSLLLVDPDPRLAEDLGKGLGDDFVVIPAADLSAAADALGRSSVDAILVAWRWPAVGACEWLDQVADQLGEAARLILTDLADLPEVHEACLKGDVEAYVARPLSTDRVKLALVEAAARRSRGDWIESD